MLRFSILSKWGGMFKTRFLVNLSLLLLFGYSMSIAQAHGGAGEPQLSDVEAGVYRLYVWTQPDPIQTGEMHVTVAVFQQVKADNGKIEETHVLDADVQIEIEQIDGTGGKLVAMATHGNATNKLLYEAKLKPSSAGKWRVTVTVESPSGSGVAGFEAEVMPAPASGFNWSLVGGLGLVLLLAGGFAVQRFLGQKKSL